MSAYDWDPQQQQQQPPQQRRFTEHPLSEGKAGGKRSRQTYSKYQTAVLETVFRTSKYIVRSKRQQMSAELDLTERQIKIWFQNRRMKEKKCRKEVQVHRVDAAGRRVVAGNGRDDDDDDDNDDDDDDNDDDDDPLLLLLRDDPFAGCRDGSAVKPAPRRQQDGYAAGYDMQLVPGPVYDDPAYDDACKLQQWPPAHTVTAVDFHRDFYDNRDHDQDHFQRLQQPATHHHYQLHHRGPLNSQVPDYCSSNSMSLQQLHGY